MIKKVNFYHVVTGDLISSSVNILSTIFSAKIRSLVISEDSDILYRVDTKLWTFASNLFIPHGLLSDGFCDEQSILIFDTKDAVENINNSLCLMCITKDLIKNVDTFIKDANMLTGIDIFICIFNGNDQETKKYIEIFYDLYANSEKKYFSDVSGKWKDVDLFV